VPQHCPGLEGDYYRGKMKESMGRNLVEGCPDHCAGSKVPEEKIYVTRRTEHKVLLGKALEKKGPVILVKTNAKHEGKGRFELHKSESSRFKKHAVGKRDAQGLLRGARLVCKRKLFSVGGEPGRRKERGGMPRKKKKPPEVRGDQDETSGVFVHWEEKRKGRLQGGFQKVGYNEKGRCCPQCGGCKKNRISERGGGGGSYIVCVLAGSYV